MFVIRIRERFKRSTNAIASNKTTPSIIHTPKIIFRIFFNVIPSIVVRTIKNSVLSNMYPQHIQYSRNPSHRPVPPSELFCVNVSAFHDFSDKIISWEEYCDKPEYVWSPLCRWWHCHCQWQWHSYEWPDEPESICEFPFLKNPEGR